MALEHNYVPFEFNPHFRYPSTLVILSTQITLIDDTIIKLVVVVILLIDDIIIKLVVQSWYLIKFSWYNWFCRTAQPLKGNQGLCR